MSDRLSDDEVKGHDPNNASGNPSNERPEHDHAQAGAAGPVLRETGGKNQPRERRSRVFLGGILIAEVLIGGGIYYWLQ